MVKSAMKVILFILCFSLSNVWCYHYLVALPVFGFSHLKFMAKVADILADGGHNVTALFTHHAPLKNIETLIKNKNIKIINYYPKHFEELKKGKEDTFEEIWESAVLNNLFLGMFTFPKIMASKFVNLGTQMLGDKKFHATLKNTKFDALIAETFDISPFYLAHILNLSKTIPVHSSAHFAVETLSGQPDDIGYVPGDFSRVGQDAGFFDRLNDVYRSFTLKKTCLDMMKTQHDLFAKATGCENLPDMEKLLTNSTYYFINSNPFLDFAKPNIGSVVSVGGITIDKGKTISPLSQEYLDILNERPSTVLISFGSVVRSFQMPDTYKNGFLKLFESLPDVTFIWKYEKDDEMMNKIPKNVHLKKWVPQPSLLADDRVKLFITHGGLGSTMELAYSGKPALMIPLFGDQPSNAMMLSRHGGAQAYNKHDVPNSEKLLEIVNEMIENPRYNENAKKLSEVLHNQPIDPKENLIKHMEFAVKFPKLETLVPENQKNGFIAYYYIDVLIFLAVIISIWSYFVYRLTRYFVLKRKIKSE